jgi:rod shape-determining protein MreC
VILLRWLAGLAFRGRELVSLLVFVGFGMWISSQSPQTQSHLRIALTGSVLFPVQAIVSKVVFRRGLQAELDRLRTENVKLQQDKAVLLQLGDFQTSLREFEGIRGNLRHPVVGARLVSRDPLRLGGLWIVDVGSDSGVKEGMAVLSSTGLVGRVLSSSNTHAKVQSLADPDCRVAVLSTRSMNPGILHSIDGSGVFVEFSVTSDIKTGDTLMTWGAGGIFPRGIPVGQVGSIRKTPANVLRTASVAPFQDPWSVNAVFVLLRPPSLRVMSDSFLSTVPGKSEVRR